MRLNNARSPCFPGAADRERERGGNAFARLSREYFYVQQMGRGATERAGGRASAGRSLGHIEEKHLERAKLLIVTAAEQNPLNKWYVERQESKAH